MLLCMFEVCDIILFDTLLYSTYIYIYIYIWRYIYELIRSIVKKNFHAAQKKKQRGASSCYVLRATRYLYLKMLDDDVSNQRKRFYHGTK
jgi:hypothetical protein